MIPLRRTRRGSIYLPLLGAAMIVTVIGLAAMWVSRLQTRRVMLDRDSAQAQACAMAAVELGLEWIDGNASWRSLGGSWADGIPLGTGTLSVAVADPLDGDLADSEEDSVVLTGIGQAGTARHKTQVTVLATHVPIDALKTCIHAEGELKVNSGKIATILNAPASTNGNFHIDGLLDGSVEALTTSGSGIVTGTLTVPAPAKDIPDATLIQTYRDLAVTIPYPGAIMEKVVLGPGANPWGLTSPDGVYYMDTGGNDITLRGVRLCGTLIVRASGRTVILDDAVFMEPFRSDYAVLIVDGNLEIRMSSRLYGLLEATWLTSFNPPTCTYQGHGDLDSLDAYPNEVRGLVHATGDVLFKNSPCVRGTVICGGKATFDDYAEMVYQPSLAENPPLGYRTVVMRLAEGSWRQTVDP